jgi:hypothetical protein
MSPCYYFYRVHSHQAPDSGFKSACDQLYVSGVALITSDNRPWSASPPGCRHGQLHARHERHRGHSRIIHAEMPEVRVIGLSMFEQANRAEALRQAGAVHYLTRSGPSEDLLAVIRRCVSA